MEKHKAIFKGVICENLYTVRRNYNHGVFLYENSIRKPYIKEDTIQIFDRYIFQKVTKILKYEDIWSGVIPRPVLEVGEEIYINDLDIIVEVSRKYRTTNDEIIYETRHVIDTIDTEETENTKRGAVDDWFRISYPSYNTFEQLKSEFITEESVEEPVEEPMERTEYVPPWEREENKKKENTWFGWFSKKKG